MTTEPITRAGFPAEFPDQRGEQTARPMLSIITVTFNADAVLEKTIKSIFSQSFDDYEFIIVDGESTDETLRIVENYKNGIAYWVSEKDSGIYDAMNKGLDAAQGEYVQFLNAGDYYADTDVLRDVFAKQEHQPDLLYGDIHIVDTDGKISLQEAEEFTLENLLRHGTGVLCHQAMFVRRSKAPKYDCRYNFKAELNWYFDLVELRGFTCKHVSQPIVFYTLGGFGYKYFIRNRLEWLTLVARRYGWSTVIESRLISFIFRNSFSRYPSLRRTAAVAKRAKYFFRRE